MRLPYGISLTLVYLLCAMSVGTTGCTIGPRLIMGSRTNYNNAVQVTGREEMLLNIVRARYDDPPEFLAIGNITTQFELGTGVSIGNEFGLGDPRIAGKVDAADRPTVTLTPLQDEKFTRRFLAPIGLDTIYLFSHSGRRVERVLRLVVSNVNGLGNNPGTYGTGSEASAFSGVAKTLGELARQRQVEIAHEERAEKVSEPIAASSVLGADVIAAREKGYQFTPAEKDKTVVLTLQTQDEVLRIAPEAVHSPEIASIVSLLKLQPGQLVYPMKTDLEGQLEAASQAGPMKELIVSTRSVEEILHFLSNDVVVPVAHIECGLVARRDADLAGVVETMDNLLHVRSSKHRPKCAALAVYHRGYWFYIDDADSESKETFELLLELYNLEIRGGGAATMPVLTLPVGR